MRYGQIIIIILYSLFHFISCKIKEDSNKEYVKLLQQQKELLTSNAEQSILIGSEIVASNASDSIKAISYYNLGKILFKQGKFSEAYHNLNYAKEKFDLKVHNKRDIIYNAVMLANVYKTIGLINESIDEIQNAYNLIKIESDENKFLKSYLLVGESSVYHKNEDWVKLTKVLKLAEKNLLQIKDPKLQQDKKNLLTMVYADLCMNYIKRKDYEIADKYLKQSILLIGDEKKFYEDYYNLFTLAEIEFGKKNYHIAIEILQNILSTKNIDVNLYVASHDILREIYKQKDNKDLQNFHQNKLDTLNLKINNNVKIANQEAYQYISNELQKNKVDFSFKEKLYVGGFILTIIFLIFVYQLNLKKQKIAYQNLKDKIINKPEKSNIVKKEDLTDSEIILLQKLQKFEDEKGFLNKNMTLANLSVQLNTNTHYLSDIINKTKGKNINTYINELRINYITKEIYNNPELLNYKISYIAELAGFNSHNSFTIIFKRVTGISPSIFLEQRRKEEK